MSLNTKKQRQHLYSLTFMKWKVERRLSTLELATIETSLGIHTFGNDATEEHFKKLCEKLSDLETMIEVAEMSFPALRPEMDQIRKNKLIVLQKRNVLQIQASSLKKKAEEKEEKAFNIPDIIKKQEEEAKNSKGLLKIFRR